MKNLLNFFKSIGDYVVDNFGFDGWADFTTSMVHTKLLLFTLPSSFLLFGVVEQWLGITSAIFISFGVMAIVELVTGLWGARALKKKWSSRKFSRFGLKILVWLSLIMVANSFKVSYEGLKGIQNIVIFQMFYWIHGTLIVYISLEYMISILENLGKITGKGEGRMVKFLKKKLDQWFETADEMTDPNNIAGNNAVKNDLDAPVLEDNSEDDQTPMEG
jgi:hypothetical protein